MKTNYRNYFKRIKGALFDESFYQEVISYKLRDHLFFILFLTFLYVITPVLNMYRTIHSIDLNNPQNELSERIVDVIAQFPVLIVEDGELLENSKREYPVSIMSHEGKKLFEVDPTREGINSFNGLVLFAKKGSYIDTLQLRSYLLDLIGLPDHFIASHGEVSSSNYEFASYENIEYEEVTPERFKDMISEVISGIDFISFILFTVIMVFYKSFLIFLQIAFFALFTHLISKRAELNLTYLQSLKLTAAAFVPFLTLDILNSMTLWYSKILNIMPYSLVIFAVCNFYFINYAVRSVVKGKSN